MADNAIKSAVISKKMKNLRRSSAVAITHIYTIYNVHLFLSLGTLAKLNLFPQRGQPELYLVDL